MLVGAFVSFSQREKKIREIRYFDSISWQQFNIINVVLPAVKNNISNNLIYINYISYFMGKLTYPTPCTIVEIVK